MCLLLECHAICMRRRYSTLLGVPQVGVCALRQRVMQCACDADSGRCFVYRRQGVMLQAGMQCRGCTCRLGAVGYSAAMCAFAPSFLMRCHCIAELLWLLTAPAVNAYIVPRACCGLVSMQNYLAAFPSLCLLCRIWGHWSKLR